MANIMLERPPQTDMELYQLVRAVWGVTIPMYTCGNPEHTAPFKAFADAYFNRGESITLWHGSRGLSGKSFMLSILGITKAFFRGSDVNLLGGSLAQSTNIHEHMRAALDYKNAPRYMIDKEANTQIKLTNLAKIRPLTASQKTVRGPHPQTLLLDEIDEMDQEILDAALGQPMPQKNWLGEIIQPYTVLCLAEDTVIAVLGGDKEIKDVEPGDQVLTREGWKRVTARIDNGYRPTVNVILSNGRTLTCTEDHQIATPEGWMTPAEMSVGQRVISHADVNPSVESAEFSSPSLVFSGASTAVTTSVVVQDVLRSELVSSNAVSLEKIMTRGSVAPDEVFVLGNRLQMNGVDAGSDLAEVIDLESAGNWSNQTDMRPAVNVLLRDEFPIHNGVSTNDLGAVPDPASRVAHSAATQEPVFIVGINLGLTRHVYDLSVDGCPEFVANGIIVHNCSTWQNPEGTFTEMKRRWEAKKRPTVQWCYECTSNEIDGWLSKETIRMKREEIPVEMWRTEYDLGEPAIGNRAFDYLAVEDTWSLPFNPLEKNESKDFEEYIFEKPFHNGIYIAAADWGKDKDYTVITVMRMDVFPYRLVYYMRVNRRPYPQMIGWFNKAINDYSAEAIHDATGVGNAVNDYVDVRARKFVMTGEKRSNMLTEYVAAVERGLFKHPKIQSAYIEMKYCRTGDLYETSKDYHLPDTVSSMALAWNLGKKWGTGVGDPIVIPKTGEPHRYEKHFAYQMDDDSTVAQAEGEVVRVSEEPDSQYNFLV